MKRTLIFFLQLAVILGVITFFVTHQVPVMISVNEYELSGSSTYFAAFLFVFMSLLIVIHKFLEGFIYLPKKIRQKNLYKNKIKGLKAIIDGLFFLSINSIKNAEKNAKIADRKMSSNIMTLLLKAKVYVAKGDYEKAKKAYRKIIKQKEYRSLGFNGLMQIALENKKYENLYTLAKQAFILDKKNAFALLNLIDCELDQKLVTEAKKHIKYALKIKAITRKQADYKLAEIAYMDAVKLKKAKDHQKAIKLISKYYVMDLQFLKLYVELLDKVKEGKKARIAIKKFWKENPDAEVANLWMKCVKSKDKFAKVDHAKELLKYWPNSPIALEISAVALIDAEIWGQAKDFLNKAIKQNSKLNYYALMAKIEKEGYKDPEKYKFWINKIEKSK